MTLSENDIKHLAHLARIELKEDEIELFRGQISQILEYVDQIQKIETSNLKTTYSWDDLHNRYREDEAVRCDESERELVLKAAPQTEQGYIKVKSVF
ncbi:MAG: Asp-tRNA(Asn)/Glu-tRNA(Gln) amidotransferase subunit GatC [Parcubacteria group bacterium]|nr:Asp-tRNA(Asn)/Glu-tRNA(Gln) amidotransferase subunit GatC [Parcubacteria group bacterium]